MSRSTEPATAAQHVSEAIHPCSQRTVSEGDKLFVVITPVLDGERFLEESLASVLDQSGEFFIDYFVKDAGSTDKTLAILSDYHDRIMSGKYPLRCHGIRLRVESSPDRGLYDAVAYGFAQPQRQASLRDIFTYINADDVIAENTFRIVAHLFDNTPAQWVCGQINVIDETGKVVLSPQFPLSYAREDIQAGLHDGRSLNFIQQEGSFWLRELYNEVGGINRALKLVGDFDLWRRFATQTELLAVDRPLASFRSRRGQLSRQMDKYYAELDQLPPLLNPNGSRHAARTSKHLQFYFGHASPVRGRNQRPGPIGFLNGDGTLKEIAYIKRSWMIW